MSAKVTWLIVFVLLYWAYCIFWGVKGAQQAKTASDYFISGRKLPMWVFVLAATATSFSGWTFLGHPGLIYRDGFPYAYASFYAITIPFTGVMFLKRQWMIGKKFGFVTPGEMLSNYFRSDTIRLLVVLVALVFSVPYLGIQLRASGFLFNVLTDGLCDVTTGMILLSLVVIIYVASGGLRAVAYVDTMQCILLAGGIIVLGLISLSFIGGMSNLIDGIAALSQSDTKLTKELTLFNIWKEGRTGIPYVDACMLKLKSKGYLHSHEKKLIASFLIYNLKLDWRLGAEYFENMLINYDPCSVWGFWNFIAQFLCMIKIVSAYRLLLASRPGEDTLFASLGAH